MNYRTTTDLLKAFEKVQPDYKRSNDVRARKDGVRTTSGGKTEMPSARRKPTRCYKCQGVGHITTQCKRAPAKRAYYVCESTEHLARECLKRSQPPTSEASKDFARMVSTNIVQPVELPKLYMIRVKIAPENINSECSYVVDAIIDSGSPIRLVHSDIILGKSRLLEKENVH